MKKLQLHLLIIFTISLLLFTCISTAFSKNLVISQSSTSFEITDSDDFYFVHITDTHIRHRLFDRHENTKNRLTRVINHVISFEQEPALIVITGDLTEWSGSGILGALNSITFANCFYEKDKQLYADPDCTIPVYTTPGNHDYIYNRNLKNYHRFIDNKHADENDRYIITYENLSMFFLDSGPNYYANPFDWLDILGDGLYYCDIKWLDDELSNCSSQHKIVLMHHPAVSRRNKRGEMIDCIARNRKEFVELCETYDVDLVLAGHTHRAIVYDSDENKYEDLPINCSQYSTTLHVQSDDCKEGIHFRNITIQGNDIWIDVSEELNEVCLGQSKQKVYQNIYLEIFERVFLSRYKKI